MGAAGAAGWGCERGGWDGIEQGGSETATNGTAGGKELGRSLVDWRAAKHGEGGADSELASWTVSCLEVQRPRHAPDLAKREAHIVADVGVASLSAPPLSPSVRYRHAANPSPCSAACPDSLSAARRPSLIACHSPLATRRSLLAAHTRRRNNIDIRIPKGFAYNVQKFTSSLPSSRRYRLSIRGAKMGRGLSTAQRVLC